MNDSPQFISLKELAEKLGMDRSHARRYVIGLGIKVAKRRTKDSGNQLALTATAQEAEWILRKRQESGFLGNETPVSEEHGYFYVIQLVPELDPGRLKLGFAVDVRSRLDQHRTSAPTASVLGSWPCRRVWEATAIDAVTKNESYLIDNEVYRCTNIEALLQRAKQFFELLPEPRHRPPLDKASPLNSPPHV